MRNNLTDGLRPGSPRVFDRTKKILKKASSDFLLEAIQQHEVETIQQKLEEIAFARKLSTKPKTVTIRKKTVSPPKQTAEILDSQRSLLYVKIKTVTLKKKTERHERPITEEPYNKSRNTGKGVTDFSKMSARLENFPKLRV